MRSCNLRPHCLCALAIRSKTMAVYFDRCTKGFLQVWMFPFPFLRNQLNLCFTSHQFDKVLTWNFLWFLQVWAVESKVYATLLYFSTHIFRENARGIKFQFWNLARKFFRENARGIKIQFWNLARKCFVKTQVEFKSIFEICPADFSWKRTVR